MARTKQTARKSKGGKAPRGAIVKRKAIAERMAQATGEKDATEKVSVRLPGSAVRRRVIMERLEREQEGKGSDDEASDHPQPYALFICKHCGQKELYVAQDTSFCTCKYCGKSDAPAPPRECLQVEVATTRLEVCAGCKGHIRFRVEARSVGAVRHMSLCNKCKVCWCCGQVGADVRKECESCNKPMCHACVEHNIKYDMCIACDALKNE